MFVHESLDHCVSLFGSTITNIQCIHLEQSFEFTRTKTCRSFGLKHFTDFWLNFKYIVYVLYYICYICILYT